MFPLFGTQHFSAPLPTPMAAGANFRKSHQLANAHRGNSARPSAAADRKSPSEPAVATIGRKQHFSKGLRSSKAYRPERAEASRLVLHNLHVHYLFGRGFGVGDGLFHGFLGLGGLGIVTDDHGNGALDVAVWIPAASSSSMASS